jgi:putative hydrolase of the HAD superfamily
MNERPIRAVIFDFGGVFTTSPIEKFSEYERANGLPARFISEIIRSNLHSGAFARFERAEIDFEAFDRLFSEETRKGGHEISGRQFLSFVDVSLKPEMARAQKLTRKAGFLTGCITNNFPEREARGSPLSAERRDALKELFDAFDHVIESSKVGVRKPEPRIYEMMCEALAVSPRECVFLDDLGVNLKPAQAMGMKTIKVPFGDVAPAIAELASLLGVPLR